MGGAFSSAISEPSGPAVPAVPAIDRETSTLDDKVGLSIGEWVGREMCIHHPSGSYRAVGRVIRLVHQHVFMLICGRGVMGMQWIRGLNAGQPQPCICMDRTLAFNGTACCCTLGICTNLQTHSRTCTCTHIHARRAGLPPSYGRVRAPGGLGFARKPGPRWTRWKRR